MDQSRNVNICIVINGLTFFSVLDTLCVMTASVRDPVNECAVPLLFKCDTNTIIYICYFS